MEPLATCLIFFTIKTRVAVLKLDDTMCFHKPVYLLPTHNIQHKSYLSDIHVAQFTCFSSWKLWSMAGSDFPDLPRGIFYRDFFEGARSFESSMARNKIYC